MVKFWLISAAISGFLSVALGAFGAHSLKNILDDYGKSIYEKAVLYQMFHTMALFAVGMMQHLDKGTSFSVAGWGFLAGIVLFSGSLYLLAITGARPQGESHFLSVGSSFYFHSSRCVFHLNFQREVEE